MKCCLICAQPRAWCWAANTGWKWHNGNKVEDFAPVIADSELPFELTVTADCDASTLSIARDGVLLGGTFVYGKSDGLGENDACRREKLGVRLAVGTYDGECKVTILSYTGPHA